MPSEDDTCLYCGREVTEKNSAIPQGYCKICDRCLDKVTGTTPKPGAYYFDHDDDESDDDNEN